MTLQAGEAIIWARFLDKLEEVFSYLSNELPPKLQALAYNEVEHRLRNLAYHYNVKHYRPNEKGIQACIEKSDGVSTIGGLGFVSLPDGSTDPNRIEVEVACIDYKPGVDSLGPESVANGHGFASSMYQSPLKEDLFLPQFSASRYSPTLDHYQLEKDRMLSCLDTDTSEKAASKLPETAKPTTKGRGRPKKEPADSVTPRKRVQRKSPRKKNVSNEPDIVNVTPSIQKPKRGRPKKEKDSVQSTITMLLKETSDAEKPKAKKRKYTRKPKCDNAASTSKANPGDKLEKTLRHKCNECGTVFSSLLLLEKHSEVHGPDMKKCEHCDFATKDSAALESHMRKKHDAKGKRWMCDECGKSFGRAFVLRRHKILVHSCPEAKVKLHCNKCDYATHELPALMVHRQSCQPSQPVKLYNCHLCGKGVRQKQLLKNHLASHRGIKEFACPICHKYFTSKQQVRTHMWVHRSQYYQCKVCDKGFVRKYHLVRHEILHKGEKNFLCPFDCEYRTAYKCNLRKHCRVMHNKVYPPVTHGALEKVENLWPANKSLAVNPFSSSETWEAVELGEDIQTASSRLDMLVQ